MNPVMTGLMMPGMVPMVLEMPMRMAAYCGAMSRWLIENPAHAKPPQPSDREMLPWDDQFICQSLRNTVQGWAKRLLSSCVNMGCI